MAKKDGSAGNVVEVVAKQQRDAELARRKARLDASNKAQNIIVHGPAVK